MAIFEGFRDAPFTWFDAEFAQKISSFQLESPETEISSTQADFGLIHWVHLYAPIDLEFDHKERRNASETRAVCNSKLTLSNFPAVMK